jgi:5'-nucleotidase
VRQGFHDVGRTRIVEGTDPRGYRYYWFALGHSNAAPPDTDLEAIADGYISVTPLHYDLTHDGSLGAVAQAFADF